MSATVIGVTGRPAADRMATPHDSGDHPEQATSTDAPAGTLEQRLAAFSQGVNQALKRIEAVAKHHGQRLEELNSCVIHQEQNMGAMAEALAATTATTPRPSSTSLEALIGYQPTPQQQMELFSALAAWRAELPMLTKNRTANLETNSGAAVSYSYADLAAVMEQAKTGGAHGLFVTCMLAGDDQGGLALVVLVLHQGGGALSSGPWTPDASGRNRLNSSNQNVSAAMTTAKRILTQNLLGIAADEDSDFNEHRGGGNQARRPAPARPAPARSAAGPTRAPAAPPAKPPPGWLDKRTLDSIDKELADPGIAPERFTELEQALAGHKAAVDAMNAAKTQAAATSPAQAG